MQSVPVNHTGKIKACSPLAGVHRRVEFGLTYIENAAAVIAGCAAVLMMILVALNALLRYGFAAPLAFQFHVTEYYLLVAATMLALPWGYRTGGAIQIRLLLEILPAAVAGTVVRLGLAASAIYLLALAWLGYLEFHEALVEHDVVMGVIDWPVAWSWIWIPIGCGLLAVRLLIDATAVQLRAIGNVHD